MPSVKSLRSICSGVALAFAIGAPSAQASLIADFQGVTDSFDFNYSLKFSTPVGGNAEQLVSGDFVTIYDFGGFTGLGGVVLPAFITASTSFLGPNPPFQGAPDSASIPNVTFTYTGAPITVDTNFLVSIHTTSGTAITGFYSGQTTNNFDQPGAKLGNTGQTMVPTTIPEPETYAMMLAGLGLMGFVARRRKQKAA